jgi:hypothetical protein
MIDVVYSNCEILKPQMMKVDSSKLYKQFIELFIRYRGEDAKNKLLENDFFNRTERTVAAIRAQKSEKWAKYLADDTDNLNVGIPDDMSFCINRPLYFTPPVEAIDFMKLFVKHFKVQSHYDVLLSTTSCSLYIDTPLLYGECVMKAQPAYEIAHPRFFADRKSGVDWDEGDNSISMFDNKDYLGAEDIKSDHFDNEGAYLVTPWLPWGEVEEAEYLNLKDVIVNSADCLKDEGFLVAWIPSEELSDTSKFEKTGLCIEAVYVLPEQESYGVEKESSLVIFKKGKWRSKCYVNRIPQSNEKILESFGHWDEDGFAKSGGDWMGLNELNVDYNIILKWRKAEKRLQRSGVPMKPFTECFTKDLHSTGLENNISHLTLSFGKEKWFPKDIIYGTYFFWCFLRSEEGKTWIKFTLNTQPDKTLCPLPSGDRLKEDAEYGLNLALLKMKIEELEKKTGKGDSDANSIIKAYASVNTIDTFHNLLPWPLSSILRAYNVETETRLKADRLNHFFEAASVFLPTLLLSLIWHNEDLKLRFGSWHSDKRTSENQNRFEAPAMGAWNNLLGSLQRFLRKEINRLGGDGSGLSAKLGGVNLDLLKKLIDKNLFNLLDKARSGRNDRAHWGALGKDEYADLLERLNVCLREFEAAVGYIFANSPLVTPVTGSTSYLPNETFEVTVRKLIGASESFDRIKEKFQRPLANDEVYLFTLGESDVVRVLPIIFIDEKNVCHFYNRLEKKGMRYVSYQADLETNTRIVERTELMTEVLAYLC